MFAGFNTLLHHLEVVNIGCGDGHEFYFIVGQNIVQSADNRSIGIKFGGIIAMALHDLSQMKAGMGMDKRRMECLTRKAETDQARIDYFFHIKHLKGFEVLVTFSDALNGVYLKGFLLHKNGFQSGRFGHIKIGWEIKLS